MGLLTTITEWKKIKAPAYKKGAVHPSPSRCLSLPTFQLSIVALFKNVQWTPIIHSVAKSAEEMK